jgi:hypothetical protein
MVQITFGKAYRYCSRERNYGGGGKEAVTQVSILPVVLARDGGRLG